MQSFIVAVWPAFLTLLAGAYIVVGIAIKAGPIVAELCFLVCCISPRVTRFIEQLPQDLLLIIRIPQDPSQWHLCLQALRLVWATGPLHVPCTLNIPNKHLSYAPEPITLHSPSCTCTLVQVTSLNLDYQPFPFSPVSFYFSHACNMNP